MAPHAQSLHGVNFDSDETNKQTNPQPTRATAPLRYKAWGALMGRAVAHAGEYVFVTPDYRNFPQARADFARLLAPRGYRLGTLLSAYCTH